MCGRYQLGNLANHEIEEIVGHDVFEEHGPSMPVPLPLWNIAPTQQAPVFRVGPDGRRTLDALRWGLVPSWAGDLTFGARTINARAETLATQPAFGAAFKARRCLVPATGFYEWRKDGKSKQPYLVRAGDRQLLLLAGLWESWIAKDTGEVVETYTIVTTAANDTVRAVHDRMPAVLPRESWSAWFDPANRDAASLARLLVPYAGTMDAQPVATTINDARRNEAPVELPAASVASSLRRA